MKTLVACMLAVMVLAGVLSAQTDSFSNQGTMRSFIIHAPSGLTDAPLVFCMHGLGSNASQQRLYTGFDAVATREGFIVVYPNGIDNSWDITGNRDVNFISALIDTMAARYSIDPARVYATGFSMGGYMSHRLGCALANRIAAIAPVSGLNASSYSCSPPRPVPVLQIHGTADSVVYFSGVASAVSGWVTRNGCPSTALTTDPYPAANATSVAWMDRYGPCSGGSEVILIGIEGLGHEWAGAQWSSGPKDVVATEEIWAFFERHSLPAGSVGPRSLSRISSPVMRAVSGVQLRIAVDGGVRAVSTGNTAHLLDGRRELR